MSQKYPSWTERAKHIGEGPGLFREIMNVICNNVTVCQEDRIRIKVFFENAQQDSLESFMKWIAANDYTEFFMEETQLNLPWDVVVLIIQKLDPKGEHKLDEYLR